MQKQQETVYNPIVDGVIWKQLLIFFFPILLGSFFQQLYNTVDTIVVGRFAGKEALAAVGAMGSFINLLFGFFIGLASGATVVLSQYVGAKLAKEAHDAVHTGIALALTGGFIVTVAGIALARPMMRLMNVPEDIFEDAYTYLWILLLGTVPAMVYNLSAGILRALGDSKRPLYFLVAGSFFNVAADVLCVAVLKLGVTGAAIATSVSQVFCAALTLRCLMKRGDQCRLELKQIRFEKSILSGILRIGVAGGLQSVMYAISNMIIQSTVNSFGSNVVAAWTAHGRLDSVMWMVMGAFGTAITTFAGQNFGAQKYHRMRESVRICMVMAMGVTALLSAALLLLCRPLLGIFVSDKAVIDIGCNLTYYMAPFYISYVAVEIFSGAIRGSGDSFHPVLFLAVCTCLFRIVWVFTGKALGYGVKWVSFAYGASWMLTCAVFTIYYLRGNWLKRRISVMGFMPEIREKKQARA